MRKLGKYKEMIRSPQFRALTTIFKGAEKGHNALALRRQIERTIRVISY